MLIARHNANNARLLSTATHDKKKFNVEAGAQTDNAAKAYTHTHTRTKTTKLQQEKQRNAKCVIARRPLTFRQLFFRFLNKPKNTSQRRVTYIYSAVGRQTMRLIILTVVHFLLYGKTKNKVSENTLSIFFSKRTQLRSNNNN